MSEKYVDRETREDLGLGREHLSEMKDKLDYFIADKMHMTQEKNDLALELVEQIKKVDQAMIKKDRYDKKYQELRDRLAATLQDGLKHMKREEDRNELRESVSRLLDEMMKLAEER